MKRINVNNFDANSPRPGNVPAMQHVNFEPTCTCQKVVPHKLLLSLQSCACWSESVVGSPRSHKCLTGTPTLVRYRTLTGTRGVCRISNYLGAPRTHPIQTDKLTRDVLVDLRHFFCIGLMKYQLFWFLKAPKSACQPKMVRVQALGFEFRRAVFWRWSNEISTFLISLLFFMLHMWPNLPTRKAPIWSASNSKNIEFH